MQTGLTGAEAARRLEQYGPNQLAEKPRPGFLRLVLDQLNNFVVILLIVAALVSLLLGETIDAAAIFAIVVLNAILGVVQESRAEAALAALQKLAAPEAQVLRDGHRVSVPASQLVPGDIVLLEAGNFVPADLRLLEAVNLRVEEAALTGESVPVQKNAAQRLEADIPLGDRKNTAFMGTRHHLRPRARGGGQHGHAHPARPDRQHAPERGDRRHPPAAQPGPVGQTARHRRADRSAGWSSWSACSAPSTSWGWPLFQSAAGLEKVVNLFMIAVSLAIAAVPEGLPAVVTISLALGMREMVKRHALIRKLASVETLGSATVICSDKTGTLTQNEMTVTRLWVDGQTFEVTGSGYCAGRRIPPGRPRRSICSKYPGAATVLWVGVLNNDAQLEDDRAMTGAHRLPHGGRPHRRLHPGGRRQSRRLCPGPERRLTRARMKSHSIQTASAWSPSITSQIRRMRISRRFTATSATAGTPSPSKARRTWCSICARSYQTMDDQTLPLDEAMRQSILAANDCLTRQALRVLGLAYRVVPAMPDEVNSQALEKDLVFAGMVGMIDPARPEVARRCVKRAAGRHPHRDDHRRLSQHRQSHRRSHRPAAARPQGDDRRRAECASTTPRSKKRWRSRTSSRASRPSTRCASSTPCAPTTKWWR